MAKDTRKISNNGQSEKKMPLGGEQAGQRAARRQQAATGISRRAPLWATTDAFVLIGKLFLKNGRTDGS
jgi:hypothetical protein